MNIGYTLIMSVSVLVGFGLAKLTQTGLRLPAWQRFGIGIGAFVGAMLGAKLPFLFDSWEAFMSGATWFSSGKTILTGLVGGYLGVEISKWIMEIDQKTGDSFVVPVAAAIAIGRLGCFQAGCCYGTPTELPWGVVFETADSMRRHPTQIYEFLFHATAAAAFFCVQDTNLFAQNRVKLYIVAYAVYRFVTEFIRPEADLYWGLTGYQISCVLIIGLFSWLWIREKKMANQTVAVES